MIYLWLLNGDFLCKKENVNLVLKSFKELRGGHLKLTLVDRMTTSRMEALWFSPPKNNPVIERGLKLEEVVEVLGEPQWNYFMGRKTLQMLVKDLRLSK